MNGCSDLGQFSEWHALDDEGVSAHAPTGPAAIQLRVADGLLDYPTGKSAMVFFFYAETDAKAALSKLFGDEISRPGARGLGALWFRVMTGPGAHEELMSRWDAFVARFGAPPRLHDAGVDDES